MASSTRQKTPCATCSKARGVFTCRGCEKDFCKQHVTEHQQELSKQFDELTLEHDQLRQNLINQMREPYSHPFMKQINEWEQQSIINIQHEANNARQQIKNLIDQHTTKLTELFTEMKRDLQKAREDDDFYETDLKQWIEKLNKLKKDLVEPTNMMIQLENNHIIPLILKNTEFISSKEIFSRAIGNIRIQDKGLVIVKDQLSRDATVRGASEYASGQHRVRFQMEEYSSGKWLFIGIISKDVPMEESSYNSRSVYGWGGVNEIFIDGICQIGFNDHKCDIEKNDIVELFIDCDQRIIRLTNERTHSVYMLPVDTSKCRLPWQINVNLYYPNDCVRILQS
jgi:hypothetical protein